MAKTTKKQPKTRKKTSVGRKTSKRGASKRAQQALTNAGSDKQPTKKDAVLALLRREQGATLAELMTTTGWQAHSVRGFISGTLRKKLGFAVAATKNPAGEHTYRIEN